MFFDILKIVHDIRFSNCLDFLNLNYKPLKFIYYEY